MKVFHVCAFPRPLGARAGPIAKQWEGEGDRVVQLNHLIPLIFPRLRRGPLLLPHGEKENDRKLNQ
jgi:hypothetical protein